MIHEMSFCEKIAKEADVIPHHESSSKDRFDRYIINQLRKMPRCERLKLLHSYNDPLREELINNRFYWGVIGVGISGVGINLFRESPRHCGIHLMEYRILGATDSFFDVMLYGRCQTHGCYEIRMDRCDCAKIDSAHWFLLYKNPDIRDFDRCVSSSLDAIQHFYRHSCGCFENGTHISAIGRSYNCGKKFYTVLNLKQLTAFFLVQYHYNSKHLLETLIPKSLFTYMRTFGHFKDNYWRY